MMNFQIAIKCVQEDKNQMLMILTVIIARMGNTAILGQLGALIAITLKVLSTLLTDLIVSIVGPVPLRINQPIHANRAELGKLVLVV